MKSVPRLYHDSDSTVTGSSTPDTFEYNGSSERDTVEYSSVLGVGIQ
jgi:hypothetical protein